MSRARTIAVHWLRRLIPAASADLSVQDDATSPTVISRRGLIAAPTLLAGLAMPAAYAAGWHDINVTGVAPSLAFRMTDADTGKVVTQHDFRGKIVLLYLGYTNCPDVCPLTLHNIELILKRLGGRAGDLRFLFITVDPQRDTLPVLRRYTKLFAAQIIGLRGTANALARLARRFRLVYSVSPATASQPYEVTHAPSIYVFGPTGKARLLIPSLYRATPTALAGVTSDLERLLRHLPASSPAGASRGHA